MTGTARVGYGLPPDLTEALAHTEQPATYHAALERLVDRVVGVKLFTLLVRDTSRAVVRRTYTNMPDAYPVLGEKPVQENAWTEAVLGRGETFLANTIDELAAVFSDFELIRSLGCESCINVPVTIGGEVVGTLNCLHEARHYTAPHVAAAESLKLPGAVAFLLHADTDQGASNG